MENLHRVAETKVCEVGTCGRPKTGAAMASAALGVAHCGAAGHRSAAAAKRDRMLARDGTFLVSELAPGLAADLRALTEGRPPIAVQRLNGTREAGWAFLDLAAAPCAYTEYPKVVLREVEGDQGGEGTGKRWQMLASPPGAAGWYRYAPLDWATPAEQRADPRRAKLTRRILAGLGRYSVIL
jgi:hypothetical protein